MTVPAGHPLAGAGPPQDGYPAGGAVPGTSCSSGPLRDGLPRRRWRPATGQDPRGTPGGAGGRPGTPVGSPHEHAPGPGRSSRARHGARAPTPRPPSPAPGSVRCGRRADGQGRFCARGARRGPGGGRCGSRRRHDGLPRRRPPHRARCRGPGGRAGRGLGTGPDRRLAGRGVRTTEPGPPRAGGHAGRRGRRPGRPGSRGRPGRQARSGPGPGVGLPLPGPVPGPRHLAPASRGADRPHHGPAGGDPGQPHHPVGGIPDDAARSARRARPRRHLHGTGGETPGGAGAPGGDHRGEEPGVAGRLPAGSPSIPYRLTSLPSPTA